MGSMPAFTLVPCYNNVGAKAARLCVQLTYVCN